MDEHPVEDLWHRVDAAADGTPPAHRNSPSITGFRSYSGGSDARLEVAGDVLRVRIAVRGQRRFLVVFACLFIPTFAIAAWVAIPDPGERVLFAGVGPVVGLVTFGVIYALIRHHESLGDYLVVDRAGGVVELPRLKLRFPRQQVAGLQWIRGRSRNGVDADVDLNLLVAEPGGVVRRYHVMGGPSRRMVEAVVRFSGLPVEETDLGRRGYRDADGAGAGPSAGAGVGAGGDGVSVDPGRGAGARGRVAGAGGESPGSLR